MRLASELTHDELLQIAEMVQDGLYLDDSREALCWDPEKQWSPADDLMALAGLLSSMGAAPEERTPYTPQGGSAPCSASSAS